MTTSYTCNKCCKQFNQKNDYTRHINNKKPCISFKQIEEMNNNISQLDNLFNNCLNIVRDSEHLVGDKAMNVINYFLILRLLEPRINSGEIDIENHNYSFDDIDDNFIDEFKNKLFKIIRFSNLALEKDDDIPKKLEYLWNYILSVHPSTKKVYLKGKGFNLKHQSSYRKIINLLNDFKFEDVDTDFLGKGYEKIMAKIFKGATLGQFFTDRKITKFMTELVKPKLYQNGKTDTIFDPAMGTGGFLASTIDHLKRQSDISNIPLDWEFIRNNAIGGREANSDTFQLVFSNMLISTGQSFTTLECGDSIRNTITNKYDIVLANPPFGIKGLEYDEITDPLKNEYLPIKTKSAVPLFLQAIIYMLNVNGRCAVILPDGQDLFTKTNTTLISIRKYLFKTCDLHEIIYLPSGIFEYTPIKTCILFFTKKKEGKDIISVNSKISKSTNKKLNPSYKFNEEHQTKSIKFYEYNPDRETKTELAEVSIEDIANNSYSLNYTEYLKDDNNEQIYNNDIEIKTLGEIMTFLPKSKRLASYGINTGSYPFYTSSNICNKYCDIPDYSNYSLIIGTGGNANIKYDTNFSCSADNFVLQTADNNLNIKYIYYYLYHFIKLLEDGFQGSTIKHISKEYVASIEIPIPSIEKQREIIQYLDFIYEKSIKTSNEKINQLKELNKMYIDTFTKYGKNEMKTLGDMCNFKNGKSIKKEDLIYGEYPVIGGGQKPMGYHNQFNNNENTILCSSSGAYAGYISKYDTKIWASDCFNIIPKINELDNTFLFYYLKSIQDKIYKSQTGTAQPHVYSRDLEHIQIHVPSIQKQKEIVKYCEHNDNLIKQLETEIENNKKQAKEFLDMILNISTNDIPLSSSDDEKSLDEQIEEHKSNTSSIQQSTDTTSNHSTKSTRSIGLLPDTILKDMCKERNIKGMSNKKKPILANKLLEYHNNPMSSTHIPLNDIELNEINKIIDHFKE